jgi:hypothetical protein
VTVRDFPKYIRDLYAAQNAFVRLGFDVNDTFAGFVDVANVGPSCFVMQLQTQDKAFTITVAQQPEHTHETAMALWREFAEAAAKATNDELHACWMEWWGAEQLLTLIGALRARGFEVPNVSPELAEAASMAIEGPRPKAKA